MSINNNNNILNEILSTIDDLPTSKGEDGFSPIVDITEIDSGHRVTITDADGTESFDVLNGYTPVKGVDYFTDTDKTEIAEMATDDKLELATETATIEPNVYYSFGEVAMLTLEFAEGKAVKRNEYMFCFTSGANATVLTIPSSVQWVNELIVEANKRYEISIVDNIGLWCAVEVSE